MESAINRSVDIQGIANGKKMKSCPIVSVNSAIDLEEETSTITWKTDHHP